MEAILAVLENIKFEIEDAADNDFEKLCNGNKNVYDKIKAIDFISNYHCAFYRRSEGCKKWIGRKNGKLYNTWKEETVNDIDSIISLLGP